MTKKNKVICSLVSIGIFFIIATIYSLGSDKFISYCATFGAFSFFSGSFLVSDDDLK